MNSLSRVMPISIAVAAILLISCAAAVQGATPLVKDGDPGTLGGCLAQADGSTATLTCEEVMWRGESGRSFAVKEWIEKWPGQPRLLVVSTRPLPVHACWSVDVSGKLLTLTGTQKDGTAIEQRVLVVSPEDVLVYCD